MIASIWILLAILSSLFWKKSLFAEVGPHNEREIQHSDPRLEVYRAIKECTFTNYWNWRSEKGTYWEKWEAEGLWTGWRHTQRFVWQRYHQLGLKVIE